MSVPTVRLVERRTREVKLPRADADFLLAHARDVIDVQPSFSPHRVRLTPRGYVGFLDGPTCRFEIRPKLPWPNLLMLLGLNDTLSPGGEAVDVPRGLLAVLAGEFVAQLEAVTRLGLVGGYHEQDTESAFLRGRLRAAEQLRDAASRAFPDRFHVTESVFDLDTPWNRIPKTIATALMARPELPAEPRHRLATAIHPLAELPTSPITEADFHIATQEPRAGAYNGLLALSRLIHDGLTATDPTSARPGGFLIDLGRAFERYLSTRLSEFIGGRRGWSVEAQVRFPVRSAHGEAVILQPDVLIRRRGEIRAVLDAKWKRPGPDAADLHQILAYAAVTGARHVGLVYPGRRSARRELAIDSGRLRVSLLRLCVVGTEADCRRSAVRLGRFISG